MIVHVVPESADHAAFGIYRELLYNVYGDAQVERLLTYVPTYIDCEHSTLLCGARPKNSNFSSGSRVAIFRPS